MITTLAPSTTLRALMAETPEITILLLGDEAVGKTTFLSKISQGSVKVNPSSKTPITLLRDIDQPYIYDISFYNRPYRLECYDTSSPTNWTLQSPNVIILCYDISSRLSLINLQRLWIKEIARHFSLENIPVLILGLKRDLRSETDLNGIIYPQEAYRIAQEMRTDKYMECSAVTGELVHEVFEDICRTAAMTTTAKGGLSEGTCLVM